MKRIKTIKQNNLKNGTKITPESFGQSKQKEEQQKKHQFLLGQTKNK